ncbi:helix-turn-helix domain-containing protein [Bacteroides sp. 214]|uniref:helix-turn-helix domain-containing protein n=1 Tax=Bacteroides sp. 214 TaxID=2302935 RepID=UPI0013D7F667
MANFIVSPIDSIHQLASSLTTDTARVNQYHKFVNNYLNSKKTIVKIPLDSLLVLSEFSLNLAKRTAYVSGEINMNKDLGLIYWYKQDYKKAGDYYRTALELSKQINDINEIIENTYITGFCETKTGLYSQALKNYLLALLYYKEQKASKEVLKVYLSICTAYTFLGDNLSLEQYALEAIEYAISMNDTICEAKFSMEAAVAYKKLHDISKAESYYNRAFDLYSHLGRKEEMARLLNNKSTIYDATSPEKLESMQKAITILKELPENPESLRLLSHIYVNIGDWYKAIGDQSAAIAFFEKGIAAVETSGNIYQAIFLYSHLAEYYLEQGNLSKSKQLAQQTIRLIDKYIGSNHSYDIALKVLSKIYAMEGNYREAFNALTKWSVVNDSVQAKTKREEINRINQRYDFEQERQKKIAIQQLDIERQKSSITTLRIVFIAMFVMCLLFATIGVLYYRYSRNLKIKNRELYNQIQAQEELEQAVKEKNQLIVESKPDAESREYKLFVALNELMESEQLYTDTNIDRKSIADKLGTNERYLHDAVKENAKVSFMEYINLLRLNHARRLLASNNYTIDDIALESGFGSKSTLYRNFRERYKLTPVEFRAIALEEKNTTASL